MGSRAGSAALRVRSEQEKELECNENSEVDVQRLPDLFCSLTNE